MMMILSWVPGGCSLDLCPVLLDIKVQDILPLDLSQVCLENQIGLRSLIH